MEAWLVKKLLLSFFIIAAFAASSCAFAENAVNGENMKISVSDGKNKIVYELNASGQSKSLYSQLPIKVQIETTAQTKKSFIRKKKFR